MQAQQLDVVRLVLDDQHGEPFELVGLSILCQSRLASTPRGTDRSCSRVPGQIVVGRRDLNLDCTIPLRGPARERRESLRIRISGVIDGLISPRLGPGAPRVRGPQTALYRPDQVHAAEWLLQKGREAGLQAGAASV